VLRGASLCQLQRAPLGKLLNLHVSPSEWHSYAGVEGSSPSLSTSIYLQVAARHDSYLAAVYPPAPV
jgi:hypothetical protein